MLYHDDTLGMICDAGQTASEKENNDPDATDEDDRAKKKKKQNKGKSSNVCIPLQLVGFRYVLIFYKQHDILPANQAINNNITYLRQRWSCNLTSCASAHCFVAADGSHFNLSHEHIEKWAGSMVGIYSVICCIKYARVLSTSSKTMDQQHLKLHQTSRYLMQHQPGL